LLSPALFKVRQLGSKPGVARRQLTFLLAKQKCLARWGKFLLGRAAANAQAGNRMNPESGPG